MRAPVAGVLSDRVPAVTYRANAAPRRVVHAPHLAGHLLARLGGVKAIHVPYLGGSPAMVGVIRGDVDVYFSSLSGARSFVQAKQAKALAVSSSFRVRTFPDGPTVSETGIADYAVNGWYGVIGPAGLPAPLVARLHDEFVKVLNRPDVRAEWEKQGAIPMVMTPDAFGRFLAEDIVKWERIVRISGAKPDQ